MNNEDTDSPVGETAGTPDQGVPTDRRPLGYWLRTVDGLLTREFADAFEGADVTRRDWMLLNALSGDVELPPFAERFARKGKRLRGLADRGWVEESGDGTWVLTDEGRAAKDRLGEIVDGIRSRVAGAVSPEDFATTIASLEAIARELGWEEGMRIPRPGFGRGRGRGFGPGFPPGFGPGFGHGFGPGFGHGHAHHEHSREEHCHPRHEHGGHRRGEHSAEHAYERGFDAGFARGRSADTASDTASDAA